MYNCISPTIKYLGVDDLDIDLFENQYPVPGGISYNSYLIDDDGPLVMDPVDLRFADRWLANLAEALDGRTPRAIVSLHLEPDHSGALARALEAYPAMELVVSAAAARMLPQFIDPSLFEGRLRAVKEGDTYGPLRFVMAPMVHWPEVMTAWYDREKTLFSADAFGTFGTPGVAGSICDNEAARYYFNIVGKYGAQARALLGKVAPLSPRRLCALHGPVLEGADLEHAVALYDKWSAYSPDLGGVTVAVASIYGNTMRAAATLCDLLRARGVEVELIDLCHTDVSYAVSAAFRRPSLVVAAASYDAGVFPPMAAFLSRLQSKGWRDRRVALIENYSWAASAARTMRAMLEPMKGVEIVGETVSIKTRPDADTDAALGRLAEVLA